MRRGPGEGGLGGIKQRLGTHLGLPESTAVRLGVPGPVGSAGRFGLGLKQILQPALERLGEGQGGGNRRQQPTRFDRTDLGAGDARPGRKFLLRPVPGRPVQPHLILNLRGR